MQIIIDTIPFSRFGSYFAISQNPENRKILLRDISGGDEQDSELFELLFKIDSEVLSYSDLNIECSETILTVSAKERRELSVSFIYPEKDLVRIKTDGLKVELKAIKERYDSFNQMTDKTYEYISYKKETKYLVTFSNSNYEIDAPWLTVGNDYVHLKLGPSTELLFESYRVTPKHITFKGSFDEAKQLVHEEYTTWKDSMQNVPMKYETSRDMASYLLWANSVDAKGLVTEPITYMSKNWMQNIWSWDNCFNAIAFAKENPKLAYDQLKVFIDHQHESGAYPDFINDKYISYNCVKPPIHARTYQLMLEENPVFAKDELLKPIYLSLKNNTFFWLNNRMDKKYGLPFYTHGNDSGWDNASIYHEGFPVIAPDLAAFLVQQMDILSEFAQMLNLQSEAQIWVDTSNKIYNNLIDHLYDGEQFFAVKSFGHEKIKQQTSAILFIPLILAQRFEEDMRDALVSSFLQRFECKFGIATEEPNSELFNPSGYWLGPVWAPETYIFVDALERAGYIEEASRISEKYCNATLIGGMAENFNPHDGIGNDDLAFSWTSSVFLLLANRLSKGFLNVKS